MAEFKTTSLEGVYIITPRRFGDHRGFFSESYNERVFADAGIDIRFVQDNHSLSGTTGTVRGLHFQSPPHAQAKLVRCGRGRIFDVAVDIRRGSPGYGRWVAAELSFENARQMLIPAGFAHGFVTLTPQVEIVYKCSDHYASDCDAGIAWDDPNLGIGWPLSSTPVLSEKDARAPRLHEIDSPFSYKGPLPWERTA